MASSHARCLNALGGTETGVLINALGDLDHCAGQVGGLLGTGLPGKDPSVIADGGNPADPGTPGLLRVESRWIGEGYLDSTPGGSLEFHPFPSTGDDRFFLTGDVVVQEGECFRHLGRSGSMIKHRGAWVDTTPLRECLREEGIMDFHLDSSGLSGVLRVWIRMDPNDGELLLEKAGRLAQRLDESPLQPEILTAIRDFPLTPNGKKDLRELARLVQAGDLIEARIPSRVSRMAMAILRHEWDAPILKGALRVGDLEIDSLSFHELLLSLERLSGHSIPSWRISPATPLGEITMRLHDEGRAFARLGPDSSTFVILWFGDGVMSLIDAFRHEVKILHWNAAAYPGADGTKDASSIRELASEMISMAYSGEMTGKVVVGGYSAGAVLAHEASRILCERAIDHKGLLLLDPPDLEYRPIRTAWRWSRWRPFILFGLLEMLPDSILDAVNGTLRKVLSAESARRVRERRRKLMRNHQVLPTSVPVVLATSESHHEGALRAFGRVSGKQEVLSLGVRDHVAVLTDPKARTLWVDRLREFLLVK